MFRKLAKWCLPFGVWACGAGGAVVPPQTASSAGPPVSQADAASPAALPPEPSGLGAPPRGLPAPSEQCQTYAGPAPTCAGSNFAEQLAAALGQPGPQRDLALRCLEAANDAPPGLIRALRADLAPRGCADVVVGERASVEGAPPELADLLVALGTGARLYRSVREPPLPRAPFDKAAFLQHFKQVLSPWIADQAHAVDVLSRVGPRLTGYAKAVVALEAGLADMRFVSVARSIELPDEMKNDPEIRETYLVALEQALEPRVARGRDAALVGLGELSRQGVLKDARLSEARRLLSELYAGRRIDALDRLLLPPLPPLDTGSPLLELAAKLPAFYAVQLERSERLDDPKLLRARLEQGVPPGLWSAAADKVASRELALLSQRALIQLGQTYFWAEPFARAAKLPPAQDENAELLSALAQVLAHGPRNAAAMMLGPPTLPAELRQTEALDALARATSKPHAGLAEFDAAYVRGLAPPANDAAFWKDQAARYQRAQKRLKDKAQKALAQELAQAAQDTEKELRKVERP